MKAACVAAVFAGAIGCASAGGGGDGTGGKSMSNGASSGTAAGAGGMAQAAGRSGAGAGPASGGRGSVGGSGGAGAPGGSIGAAGISGQGGRSGAAGRAAGGGPTAVVAFPGAVGFGKNATGGRSKSIYRVTTLADSGAGSFRDAVSVGNRFIVFAVGGYIELDTPVSVKSNLTIAGQTAPGDGIGIMAREVSFANASNVVVRGMRFRQGDLDPDSSKSGINLVNASTLIFDHVSIEFAQWNNIDAVGASNITVMNSIDADPIGQQFNAHTETGPYTWYRNVFANAHNRNPLAKANTQYINNVIYNFQLGYTAGNTAGLFSHDLVGNYFITGPSTTTASDALFQVNNQKIYANGNLLDSNSDGTLNGTALGAPGAAVALGAPWSSDTAAIAAMPAAAAFTSVLADAGDSLHRDGVDAQVIAEVMSLGKSGSLWTTQTKTGLPNTGYGTLDGGTAPTDTDGDGMPDAWEQEYGLNPHDASDANGDFDGTGYTNIEKYVNSLFDGAYP
jgi:hypothetical protein